MKNIEVAVGLLWRRGRVLAAQRPEGKAHEGYWEFPGGKRGKPGILREFQTAAEHEDQDEMVAAAGAVIFKSAEMLDITVRQIRHGCGGKKNIF